MIVLFTMLLIIFSPIVWWYLTINKYKSLNNIPGPTPLPIIGNALQVGTSPQELLTNLSKFTEKYGQIYRLYIGTEVKVVITNPEIIEKILNSSEFITKSDAYDMLKEWLGDGLLVSSGQKWKSRRKLLTPAFHFKIIKDFVEVFNRCADQLVLKLSTEANKKPFNIFPYINLCTLDVICETAMGVKINALADQNKDYFEAVQGFLDQFVGRVFSAWKRYQILYKLSSDYKYYKSYLKTLHNFTKRVIETRRKDLCGDTRKSSDVSSESGIKDKTALLDLLLKFQISNCLSDEDLREEIDTFMFGGHDTTSSALSFAIFALANHPESQEKIIKEIVEIFGSHKEFKITMQSLQETKYLDMFIKEVQRCYPSVPLMERRMHKNCVIGQYSFPKGTILSLYIYGTHHSSKNFKEPAKFNPERFAPENQATYHNFAYIPFSAGPRNCIGQKFALLEMKTILIKILRNFRIAPVPRFTPQLGLGGALFSYNGICVQLSRRQMWK